MSFREFRDWALKSSRAAARRWEEPDDDEIQVLLAVDDYGAHHVIPVPPFYLKLERGHVYWLRTLPAIVANRSLRWVAYRASAWGSVDPTHADAPVDDPSRFELLTLHIAEKGRYEVWSAIIKRSARALPFIGEWKGHTSQEFDFSGAIPKHLRAALDGRQGKRGPTMPAADLVLGPWDVPDDFLPLADVSGPLDAAKDRSLSSYVAIYRTQSPGPRIMSEAIVLPPDFGAAEYVIGATEAQVESGNTELDGPKIGQESRYFGGTFRSEDGTPLYRYTALWRYPGVFCEVSIAAPPGRYTKTQIYEYAAVQDRRALAAFETRLAGAH